jgi:endonuclease IV
MLSFNISTSDKKLSKDPCQIMPIQRKYLTQSIVNSYENVNNKNILIHTSYVTKIFTNNALNMLSKVQYNLKCYIELAKKIGSKYILIHGPSSKEEYDNFGKGLQVIKQLFNDTDINVCIEIPSFARSLLTTITDNYNFINNYLDFIIEKLNCEIVLDTAHLHANGLGGKDIAQLIQKYKDNYTFIHLNGNSKAKYCSDVHTPIESSSDKLTYVSFILESIPKDKYLISESPCGDWNYWVELCKKYNLKLVDFNDNYNF